MVQRIKELAKRQQLSITELEKEIGLGNGAIGKWNSNSPKLENILKVAEYFNVSLDYIATGKGQEDEDRGIILYKKLSPKNKLIIQGKIEDKLEEQLAEENDVKLSNL